MVSFLGWKIGAKKVLQEWGFGFALLPIKGVLGRSIYSYSLAQVKAGKTSENLLNEIRQIIYLLYQEKEITKKVYNNKMNSIKL